MDVRSFDNLDEAMEFMREGEEAANQRITPQQQSITYGDHWMRPMGPDYQFLVIFGRVLTVAEQLASELFGVTEFSGEEHYATAVGLGNRTLERLDITTLDGESINKILADQPIAHLVGHDMMEGFAYTARSLVDSYKRGYRFGKCWSVWEPEGEYGSTHVSEMMPLRPEEFEDARNADWDFHAISRPDTPNRKDWAVQQVILGTGGVSRDISR